MVSINCKGRFGCTPGKNVLRSLILALNVIHSFQASDVGWLLTIKLMIDPDNQPGWQSSSVPTFNTSDLLNVQMNAVTARPKNVSYTDEWKNYLNRRSAWAHLQMSAEFTKSTISYNLPTA
jgi:hypothetical protein